MNPDTNRFEHLSISVTCLKCGKVNQPHYVKCLGCGEPLGKYIDSSSSGKNDPLADQIMKFAKLVRPDGSPVPDHWSVFQQGEHVVIKNYTFKVGYIGDAVLVLEPVGPYVVGGK